jgi:hypothetical protein
MSSGSGLRPVSRFGRRDWWQLGITAGITLLLYLPTLRYGFVWDDNHLITGNRFLTRATIPEVFARDFWFNPDKPPNEGDMSYYRPLPVLSFLFERREFELSPAGYHLTNILLHLAAVVLLWFVLRELAGPGLAATLGTLFYALNPAMNCGVTFISNRTYLLAGVLLLLSFLMLLQGRRDIRHEEHEADQPLHHKGHKEQEKEHRDSRLVSSVSFVFSRPVVFALALLGALLSVEAALVGVVIAAGWLLLPGIAKHNDHKEHQDHKQRHSVFPVSFASGTDRGRWFIAGGLALLVYLGLRLGVAKISLAPPSVTHWATLQPLRVLNTFGQQLFLFVVPFGQRVIYTVGSGFTGFSVYTVFGLLFLLVPPVLLAAGRRLSAVSALGYAWMVLFLLPFSNLLFLGPSGRMLYLSGIGVVILILSALPIHRRDAENAEYPPGPARPGMSRLLPAICCILSAIYLTAFAVQLVRRNEVWFDELSLSRAMASEAPDSPGAHLNLGAELAKRKQPLAAVAEYRLAIENDSNYISPHNRLAFALLELDSVEGALAEFRAVVRLEPSSADARNNLALTMKRAGMLDSAIANYQAALTLEPSDTTLNNLGRALLEYGDARAAIATLKPVLARQPGFAAARANLADAYMVAGFPDSADMVRGR